MTVGNVIGTIGDLVEDIAVRLGGPVKVATDTPARIERRRGGSAANMAVSVARHGRPARFIGQVGDDAVGVAMVGALAAEGVDVVVRRAGRTGTIIVLLDAVGERTMLTDRGACADLADPDPAWLDGLGVLHVPAYSLVGGALASTTATLIGWAHERGVRVSIDLSSAALINDIGAAPFGRLIAGLRPDVVLANELEADCLGGPSVVAALGAAVTVVKQGAAPALLYVAGADPVEVPASPLRDVSDTTGAGDAFAAGLLSGLHEGLAPVAAVEAGHRSAAAAITAH
ncbi:MAG: PfkB family carbohydrate kinase [Actinomycetota bacterium]